MPITGPSSYVPTTNQFLQHWLDVNVILGLEGPLVLEGGITIANLTAYRDQLSGFAASIQGKINVVEVASGSVDIKKAAMIARIGEFNRKVRGFLGATEFAVALPDIPSQNAGPQVVLEALDDVATLWAQINAATIAGFTGPLTLLGGYVIATFTTDLATLRTAYTTWQAAEQSLKLERERRNDVQDLAYAAMLAYRKAVLGSFAPTDAIVDSLPRLTPEPGSTPDPVHLSGLWNEQLSAVVLTVTASNHPNLAEIEIRACDGATYDSDTETVVANLPPGTLSVTNNFNLLTPGDVRSFKAYVILTTGNEAGSNQVTITRPAAPPP